VHKLNVKQRNELHKYNIGFVFQSYHLIDSLTVYENLEIPLSYKNIPHKERSSLVCDALDRFNIVGKKDLFRINSPVDSNSWSGVARAVIQRPKLILADEPTGNLHSAQGEEIMELFKKLNEEGTTIIQVTHSEKNATYGTASCSWAMVGWSARTQRKPLAARSDHELQTWTSMSYTQCCDHVRNVS